MGILVVILRKSVFFQLLGVLRIIDCYRVYSQLARVEGL